MKGQLDLFSQYQILTLPVAAGAASLPCCFSRLDRRRDRCVLSLDQHYGAEVVLEVSHQGSAINFEVISASVIFLFLEELVKSNTRFKLFFSV